MGFAVEPSTEIAHRYDFPLLCNARGIIHAVEVGVDMGIFARDFLDRWKGHWLILVDDYSAYTEMPWGRQPDMMVAVAALMPFHGRFRFVVESSPKAAEWLTTQMPWIRPGFVYIDAAHAYEAVKADLEAWWDLVEPGGILAGHDHDADHPGVVRAVREFAEARGLVVRLTHEATCASWYCYKGPEPETLVVRLFEWGEAANPHAKGGG